MFNRIFLLIITSSLLVSCGAYKQNIMFLTPGGFTNQIETEKSRAEQNYIIQKNDLLTLQIYSNNGEKLIDPNPEMSQSQSGVNNRTNEIQYQVDLNGVTKFPLIGELRVEGLTLRQAEQMAQKEYEKFYKSPFVLLQFNNKRVIVLGDPGGQVIPLQNENVTLAEVLALAKGISSEGKAHNIRVLRGDKVFVADFSTIDGYKTGNIIMEPGDIIYIEPVRKPIAEGFRDYSILITFLVSITTLITLLTR
jgi:polysaccharide export outer membrane protein